MEIPLRKKITEPDMTASALEISNNSGVSVLKPMIYLIRLATSLSTGPCISVNCESWIRAKLTFDKSELWHFEYCLPASRSFRLTAESYRPS